MAYSSLFLSNQGESEIAVLIYVDDLIITGNDPERITSLKAYLDKCFHIQDLGRLKDCIGIEVARSSEGIFLSQRKYTLDLLKK